MYGASVVLIIELSVQELASPPSSPGRWGGGSHSLALWDTEVIPSVDPL